jgi:hypothetical protein
VSNSGWRRADKEEMERKTETVINTSYLPVGVNYDTVLYDDVKYTIGVDCASPAQASSPSVPYLLNMLEEEVMVLEGNLADLNLLLADVLRQPLETEPAEAPYADMVEDSPMMKDITEIWRRVIRLNQRVQVTKERLTL